MASPRAAVLDVEAAAAEHLTVTLRRHGCTVRRQTVGPSRLVQADVWNGTGHMLMCLRTSVAPGEPAELTADEAKAFRLEAARAHANPWVAQVVLGPELELVRLDWGPLEECEPRK